MNKIVEGEKNVCFLIEQFNFPPKKTYCKNLEFKILKPIIIFET